MSSPLDGDIYVPARGRRNGSEKAVLDMNAPSFPELVSGELVSRGPVEQCHFCEFYDSSESLPGSA